MPKTVDTQLLAYRTEAFAAYPLAQLAVPFGLGILGALWMEVSPAPLIAGSFVCSLVFGAALLLNKRGVTTILLMFTVGLLGASLAAIEKFQVPVDQIKRLINEKVIGVGEPVELTGVLERDPEIAPERLYLQVRVSSIRSRGRAEGLQIQDRPASGVVLLLVSVRKESTRQELARLDLRYGARLRVMTRLERADSFRNPGISSFTEYLDRKGYDASGFVKSPLLIERLENDRVFLPLAWLYDWRRRLQTEIDAHFSAETAGVLDAAMLGNRYQLSHSTAERFREGGTFHALVISGLHITFLGGLVFVITRRFTRNRVLQFTLSAAVLWAYAFAVGAESSVARAALMFSLLVFAPLVSRRATSLNILGATALALLAWRPSDLLDPSFQLTFVSVMALVIFSWPLLEKLSAIGGWRPTRQTPYPPRSSPWLRLFCESLFWSERQAKRELERANYSYKLFKSPLAATLERLHLQRIFRYAFAAIVVSASVQLALLPFLIIYFHRVSLASLVLNIGVSVLLAAVAFFAALALIVAQFSASLAAPLINITNSLNWLMVHSVDPFAAVGAASVRVPEYTGSGSLLYLAYYFPLAVLAVSLSRWNPLGPPPGDAAEKAEDSPARIRSFFKLSVFARATVLIQLLIVLVLVLHPWSEGEPNGKLRVDFLDVGQGDAALVTFPDKTTLLIDGGGRPGPFQSERIIEGSEIEETFERETQGIGETVVSEYLWWRGLDHIDYLLATHADADHIDGLNDVAQNFHVRAVLIARTPQRDPEYAKLTQTLARQNIQSYLIGAGDVLRFGGATADVLWPLPLENSKASSANNDSIVLRLQLGERALLLTGDVEAPGEAGLLQTNQMVRADVVKVPHHGSKTSSTHQFVDATKPAYAIFSVGQTSMFGHPHAGVVERWRAAGARILTTGKSGTITITTDGKSLKLETFVK